MVCKRPASTFETTDANNNAATTVQPALTSSSRVTVDLNVIGMTATTSAMQTDDWMLPLFPSLSARDFFFRHVAAVNTGSLPATSEIMPFLIAFLRQNRQVIMD